MFLCVCVLVPAKKDEVEVPEKEAKEKHQKAWEGESINRNLLTHYIGADMLYRS